MTFSRQGSRGGFTRNNGGGQQRTGSRPARSGGALFINDRKRGDKSPDYTGTITIDNQLLDDIIKRSETHREVKLGLIGYENTSDRGTWLRLLVKVDDYEPGTRRGESKPRSSRGSEDSDSDKSPWD